MSSLESFRAARWIRTSNLLIQALLFLTLFLGLNYIALHYALRFDLTKNRSYSLSAETISYLKTLERPIKVTVAIDDSELTQEARDVRAILQEYVYATKINDPGRITVDYLNVYVRGKEAKVLGIEPNTILLTSGNQRHLITLD